MMYGMTAFESILFFSENKNSSPFAKYEEES